MTTPTQGEHAQTEAQRRAKIIRDWCADCRIPLPSDDECARLVAALTAQPAAPQGVAYAATPDGEPSNVDLRGMWYGAGGAFHGPNVETGTMPEAKLLPFLRSLASNGQAPAGAASEPIAYLHDDGYWTPAKTAEGRKLNDRLHFAGSPKIGVHLAPTAQAAQTPTHEQIAAYLEATGSYVTNDATREAAIASAIEADRTSRGAAPAAGDLVAVHAALYGASTFVGSLSEAQPYFRSRAGDWLCIHYNDPSHVTQARKALHDLEALAESPQAPAAGAVAGPSAPEGWKLVKQSRLDDIADYAKDPSIACYRGRNIYDEQKVHQNWEACRSSLSSVEDEMRAIREGWDDEELQEALAAAPTPAAQADRGVQEDAPDPLQGAANWLAEAHGQFSPVVLLGV